MTIQLMKKVMQNQMLQVCNFATVFSYSLWVLFYSLGGEKRKKSDDEEDLDDRLEDEDYDLLEENLGVKVERRVSKKTANIGSDIIWPITKIVVH